MRVKRSWGSDQNLFEYGAKFRRVIAKCNINELKADFVTAWEKKNFAMATRKKLRSCCNGHTHLRMQGDVRENNKISSYVTVSTSASNFIKNKF